MSSNLCVCSEYFENSNSEMRTEVNTQQSIITLRITFSGAEFSRLCHFRQSLHSSYRIHCIRNLAVILQLWQHSHIIRCELAFQAGHVDF